MVACIVTSEQASDENVRNPTHAKISVEQFLRRLRDCAVICVLSSGQTWIFLSADMSSVRGAGRLSPVVGHPLPGVTTPGLS